MKLLARRGLGLDGLLEELRTAGDIPQLTREVLFTKLSAACEGFENGRCRPHPALTKDVDLPPPPAVIRVSPSNPLVAAIVAHGVLAKLLKRGGVFVAVDEYHKIAPRLPVEDPVERALREGRHRGGGLGRGHSEPPGRQGVFGVCGGELRVFQLGGTRGPLRRRGFKRAPVGR
ncbi:hypothetical protein [Pyrobaculum aerophilum]|uniref:hypothetical protein n=1 Tax=Pyrobaculum aerophilum TaxID=13773 RepID=UPI0021619193|nr:hypothetical protein [Pyrobaculum aerophilum]